MLKEYYDLHPHIFALNIKLRSKSFDYAHDDDVIKMKSPCLLSFSQGQVIYSNLATVATVILWSSTETVAICSPSTVWDDNSSTMVKQANFVDKLSSNYFHNITR